MSDNNELYEELARLRKQRDVLYEANNVATKQLQELNKQVAETERQLNEAIENIAVVMRLCDSRAEDMARLGQQIDKQRTEIFGLYAKNDVLREQVAELLGLKNCSPNTEVESDAERCQ